MSPVTIELKGFAELERRLRDMPPRIERACLRKALRSAAHKVKARMKAGTPFRTGFARHQIRISVRVSKNRAVARVHYKGKPAFYMRVYERGSRRQRARPYLAQAIAGYEHEAIEQFTLGLRQAVEKVGAVADVG